MNICHINRAFLFEARPDLLPEGFLTETELGLWSRFYEELDHK
jgi:hypothetical protein